MATYLPLTVFSFLTVFSTFFTSSTYLEATVKCGARSQWASATSAIWTAGRPNLDHEVLGLGPKMIRINPLHENDDECGSNNLHSFNLIGSPFRLSTQNILQLYNCSQECYNCTIPLSLNTSTNPNCSRLPHQKMCCEVLDNSPYWGTFFNRFPSSQSSDFNSLNSSGSDFTSGFTSLENYTLLFGCSAFTAWAYSTYAQDSSFHAEFGLNLDWYLEGPCLCSSNSKCIQRPGVKGFNCQCNPPYSGDGYVQCLLGNSSTLLGKLQILDYVKAFSTYVALVKCLKCGVLVHFQ